MGEADDASYLVAADHGLVIASESDVLVAIGLCGGEGGLLLGEADVAPAFFTLETGLAGAAFQKFVNYGVRVALVLPEPARYGRRVEELAREHAKHPRIRIVATRAAAAEWLSRTP